jgi:hypothetical protein
MWLLMEMLRSSEMLVLTRATQRNIPEDGIIHCLFNNAICNPGYMASNIWAIVNNELKGMLKDVALLNLGIILAFDFSFIY